jgi:hypothetical protein
VNSNSLSFFVPQGRGIVYFLGAYKEETDEDAIYMGIGYFPFWDRGWVGQSAYRFMLSPRPNRISAAVGTIALSATATAFFLSGCFTSEVGLVLLGMLVDLVAL